jgi:hypothetical protein
MIIRRAPHRDARAQLHQFSNNWISAQLLDGPDAGKPVILDPAAVELEPDEVVRLIRNREADLVSGHRGLFWDRWRIDEDTRRLVPTGAEPLHSPRRQRTPKHWGRRR